MLGRFSDVRVPWFNNKWRRGRDGEGKAPVVLTCATLSGHWEASQE